MSVAAASGAVSTQQHQPTAEQIRLAQLIHDNKHDQPEVQEIVRKVLDVVANSNTEEALLALFDCDYDYERTVALLIEKGNEISSEWRTATNHKTTKKQQQQKNAANKNGHGGEADENVQQQGHDGSTNRGKSRGGGGRSRIQQQQNGGDSQTNTQQQQNDNYTSQQRYRGGSSYRGRHRGNNRGNYRGNDRNSQQHQSEQQPQDSYVDSSTPSDTTQRSTNVPYKNRRDGRGRGGNSSVKHQPSDSSSNWNGESSTVSKSKTNDEQPITSDNPNASHIRSGTVNGPNSSSGVSTLNNVPNVNTQQKSKGDFDVVEVTRQIKSAIGIGQSQQQNSIPPQPLMDIKPIIADQQKSHVMSSKSAGQMPTTKIIPLPRIPHQPVIFSDRFDGGVNKIDVQFGNLGESAEEPSSQNISVPASSSSAVFYSHSETAVSTTKPKNVLSSVPNSQRSTATMVQHPSAEQSAFVSPPMHTTTIRVAEQPVLNQQRMIPPQMQQQQQPSMTMKPVVPPQYAVHHQQHQMNPQNLPIQSLLYHHSQQEPVPLDTSYDPTAFPLPSIDFNMSYFMATAMNQQPPPQQQTQQRYLVSQAPPPPQQQQQISSNRQQSSANVQTPPLSTASSSSSAPVSSSTTAASTAPKKGPAVPPGIFLSTAPPTAPAAYSTAYSTAYGVPPSVGGQQQAGATTYSAPYDTEHLFQNPFLQLNNPPQTQSPTGAYGSVTPPVQQQNQALNNNDNKTMSFRGPVNENLLLLQQFQQFSIQQANSQQQGPQATHSPAQLNYFLGHSASGPSYSPGPIMYAQPATAMAQQQASKQQAHQYNQTNSSTNISGNDDYYGRNTSSSSSNKEAHYMYAVSTQPQQVPPQSVGQHQGVNKQQRNSGNVYNNQQGQQRPF